jgi:hypothetical protein
MYGVCSGRRCKLPRLLLVGMRTKNLVSRIFSVRFVFFGLSCLLTEGLSKLKKDKEMDEKRKQAIEKAEVDEKEMLLVILQALNPV